MIRQASFAGVYETFAMFYQICFGMVPDDLNENLTLDEAKAIIERSNTRDHELWLDCRDFHDEEDVPPQPVIVEFDSEKQELVLSWETLEGVRLVATLTTNPPHSLVANGHCLCVNDLLGERPEFELVGPDRTNEAEALDQFVSGLYADEKYYGILNHVEGDIRREWHASEGSDPNRTGWLIRLRASNGPLIRDSVTVWVDTTEEAKGKLAQLIEEQAEAVEHYREWERCYPTELR